MRVDQVAVAVAFLSTGALLALSAGFVMFSRRRDRLAERLLGSATFAGGGAVASQWASRGPSALMKFFERMSSIARPVGKDELLRLQERLQQGGVRSEHGVTLFLTTKLGFAVGLLSSGLWANAQRARPIEPAFLVAVLAFAAGFYLPDAWLSSRTRSRQTAIERGLPDALDLLVTCVEAGLGLDAAVQRVADELRLAWPLLASELQTTFFEVNAGIPRAEAFRRLAARTGVKDLKSLAATLTQTEMFGTSVALALRIQAESIRVRRMQRAEERAAYVAVKMTLPLILCVLPSLLSIVVGPAIANIARIMLPSLGGGR